MDGTRQPATSEAGRTGRRRTLVVVGAVVFAILVAALAAWIVVDRTGDDSSTAETTATPVAPVIVSSGGLSARAATAGHPVYWAGPISGRKIEFSQTADDKVYVRYLPLGVKVGDPRALFLTVATYPVNDAYNVLLNAANGKEIKILGGGIAAVSTGQAQSVHFAFPGVPYQGEVFHPSPARSLRVATSGAIQPVP